MARPPIIISNGGIVDILTKGLDEDQVNTVRTNLKNLLIDEKKPGSGITKVSRIRGGNTTPERYWRLKDEKKDPKYEKKLNDYKNHPFWGEVFEDMDGSEE